MTSPGQPRSTGRASLREVMGRVPRALVRDAGSGMLRADRDALVRAGVPAADVVAYRDAVYALTGWDLTLDVAADRLCTDLLVLSISWPDLSVRAGLGWVLVARSDPGMVSLPGRRPVPAGEIEEVVAPWEVGGLVEDGWLFAAAGVGRDEAAAAVAAGTVDRGALATLAGLRGVPLPTP